MDRVIKAVVFYQIRDDYLNFSAYASQKGFAEDMNEGKFSFPIVCGIEKHPELRGQILVVFRQRPASATAEAQPLCRKVKDHMIKCIASSGGFDHTLKRLKSMEHEIELGMVKIEEKSGQANSLLRLCLTALSMEGEEKICFLN
ncbi:hypothetical protein FOPG_16763 [Fusarium oxysporum f. sp. conglutinans race 2 54008]|uniref:Geranylgeranyl pyrophosphate synthase n=2 Tax=Fusarium oxysporum TaxID=5507 RepID=X0GTX4_FUSOX|nr:hypothetical protein FOVG_02112 [Fusarium oxysporum f. sp. pisi HDV247]EXL67087.1 hypothetical protein FOPG_16763 [Fusarium oxysporum f. sp. conglutinans race 2 54008]KAG6992300.1 Geranylgeranyl pyrophosphate synthase [Fusarium oxysporum f. sp. conglutinans]KAJ4031861.1 hypothetical protein NW758_012151 [Fusarium oxysporum]WKT38294.1 Isoprenoid synthase domain superfamily [Fusarium oxysporum f. sp. vasinfectum]